MLRNTLSRKLGRCPILPNYDDWFETCYLKVPHCVGDVVFFVEEGHYFYGGIIDHITTVLAFDTALDRPVRLTDVITNPSKLRRLLPRYVPRDVDENDIFDHMCWNVDFSNFYVKDGKMVFFIQPGEVVPMFYGVVEVLVPLKTLKVKKLLTTYGQKLFK